MKNVNLYGEDGIAVHIDQWGDVVEAKDETATLRVVGHAAYACSLDEARESIRREYLRRRQQGEEVNLEPRQSGEWCECEHHFIRHGGDGGCTGTLDNGDNCECEGFVGRVEAE